MEYLHNYIYTVSKELALAIPYDSGSLIFDALMSLYSSFFKIDITFRFSLSFNQDMINRRGFHKLVKRQEARSLNRPFFMFSLLFAADV